MDLLSAIISTRARATTTTTTTTTTTGRPAGRPAGAGADGANGVHRRLWLRLCVPGVRPGVPGVVATVIVLFPINDRSASLIGKLTRCKKDDEREPSVSSLSSADSKKRSGAAGASSSPR